MVLITINTKKKHMHTYSAYMNSYISNFMQFLQILNTGCLGECYSRLNKNENYTAIYVLRVNEKQTPISIYSLKTGTLLLNQTIFIIMGLS